MMESEKWYVQEMCEMIRQHSNFIDRSSEQSLEVKDAAERIKLASYKIESEVCGIDLCALMNKQQKKTCSLGSS